jgi:hypothetical protein
VGLLSQPGKIKNRKKRTRIYLHYDLTCTRLGGRSGRVIERECVYRRRYLSPHTHVPCQTHTLREVTILHGLVWDSVRWNFEISHMTLASHQQIGNNNLLPALYKHLDLYERHFDGDRMVVTRMLKMSPDLFKSQNCLWKKKLRKRKGQNVFDSFPQMIVPL